LNKFKKYFNTTPEHTAPSAHHVQCHVKVTEAAQAFYSEI